MKLKGIKQNYTNYARVTTIIALLFTAAVPSAWARGHKSAAQTVEVVGKLSFAQKPAADMLLHQANGKSYLFVRLADDAAVVVIDVTRPEKPKTVSSLESSSMVSVKRLAIQKDVALVSGDAASEHPDAARPAPSANNYVTVWDISKAGAPRKVQEFPGVKRIIEDERGYIYILDQEALWILSDKPDQPAGEDDMLRGIFG